MNIELKNVSLCFDNKEVLKSLNFTIEYGKIYGLLGRNGAGKTTLLSLLAGFLKQTSGQILVNNEPLFENQSLIENIVFVNNRKIDSHIKAKKALVTLKKIRPQLDLNYAYHLLELFQIPTNISIAKLSFGKQAALHAIVGLATQTPIIIYDEITVGMDAPTRELFYQELLKNYLENPHTIILSSHIISEMENMFEEVIIIDQGKVVLHQTTEELQEKCYAIIGDKTKVEEETNGLNIISQEEFGNQKRVVVFEHHQEQKVINDLLKEPVSLQQLFILITKGGN